MVPDETPLQALLLARTAVALVATPLGANLSLVDTIRARHPKAGRAPDALSLVSWRRHFSKLPCRLHQHRLWYPRQKILMTLLVVMAQHHLQQLQAVVTHGGCLGQCAATWCSWAASVVVRALSKRSTRTIRGATEGTSQRVPTRGPSPRLAASARSSPELIAPMLWRLRGAASRHNASDGSAGAQPPDLGASNYSQSSPPS
mmetsp:Transcript_87662/g.151886  ORF Transcript_87662/g.151886 Transcript_87662/m.151886 type:complete len:202 (+) Transcript_87662:1145-1750(+)